MDIKLSQRVQRIKPSPTLAVTAKAAELRAAGRDVIGLGAGEPDFDTPEPIKAAAKTAIDEGRTKYTPVDGTPGLKDAIIDKFRRDNGLEYERDQILVSCGAKQSFFNLCQALLDSGDEVIIPAPYWVSYPDMVKIADGEPVTVEAGVDSRFKISAEQLETAITPRTRLVVLNSPSNPTGMCYDRDELAALGAVLEPHPDVLVVTDDIYEHIRWTGEPFHDIASACPALAERTIVLNGISKAYAMTGWRIGYAAGPTPLIEAMKKVQSQSTSNPASVSQAAAEAALRGDQGCIDEMVRAFRERHDFVHQALNRLPGVTCAAGDGTFYAFPSFHGVIERLDGVEDDTALAEHLLEECEVALVPGSAFGAPGYMRVSFATGMDNLERALERLEKRLSGL